jgi:hypothetical protein
VPALPKVFDPIQVAFDPIRFAEALDDNDFAALASANTGAEVAAVMRKP